jgi:hypothetical protein
MTKVKLPAADRISNGEVIESEPLSKLNIQISAPKMRTAEFEIEGTAPLVIHRFSQKAKMEMMAKMTAGSVANKGKKREPMNVERLYNEARYISPEGWDGFNVSAVRNGLISACRIVSFKMTLAKMGVFVLADGRDKLEPQFGLIRIYGKPVRTEMTARVETGAAYVTVRPMYDPWSAKIRIRFDSDMFSFEDIANLLSRMGEQVGLCEGRPDSKNSAGMGWGVFVVKGEKTDEKR